MMVLYFWRQVRKMKLNDAKMIATVIASNPTLTDEKREAIRRLLQEISDLQDKVYTLEEEIMYANMDISS